jgi:hypothetical protein
MNSEHGKEEYFNEQFNFYIGHYEIYKYIEEYQWRNYHRK